MMNICSEIKKRFIRLSRGQRKVAQFVIDNPNIVVTHTASEVGKLIGVSESTVIRFCYAIDLSGFSELQEKMKKNIVEANPNQLTHKEHPLMKKKEEHLLSEVMNRDVASILRTIQQINEDDFRRATRMLHDSHSIYILGFRKSAPTASFTAQSLNGYGKAVKQIEHDVEHIVQQLSKMDKESLLIILALDSIQEDVTTIAKLANNKKVKVIAITHPSVSPTYSYADIVFTLGAEKQQLAETIITSHSFIHALIEGMKLQNTDQYSKIQSIMLQTKEKAVSL